MYINQSMSVRAYEAYQVGKKPLSKWKKQDFNEIFKDYPYLKKLTVKELRSSLLECTEWHHTSSYFNRTDFYEIVDSENFPTEEQVAQMISERKKEERSKESKATITYVEWVGKYRKWRKPVEYTEECIIVGNWAYLSNGSKKKIDGNNIKNIEYK